ncbi:hypothetical protein QOZ80_2AG0147520 [Eleusine coracana subsp. coracana]|nr:hypothetical protein QOZ80_2AG0147520 [Eleusine coracana subsp. coracana]
MKPSVVSNSMERATEKKPAVPMTKNPRRCSRFLGGDNKQDGGAFTDEEKARLSSKLKRYICVRCGLRRGEHRYAGTRDELLPPRKRSVFRRLVQFNKAQKEKRDRMEEGEVWTVRAVTKGKRAPRRKLASGLWAKKLKYWLR